jgi:hypothetical protein
MNARTAQTTSIRRFASLEVHVEHLGLHGISNAMQTETLTVAHELARLVGLRCLPSTLNETISIAQIDLDELDLTRGPTSAEIGVRLTAALDGGRNR